MKTDNSDQSNGAAAKPEEDQRKSAESAVTSEFLPDGNEIYVYLPTKHTKKPKHF
jgi:hypothetical protein